MRATSTGKAGRTAKVQDHSRPTNMLRDSLVIIDFETTGLSPERGDRITEVGLVRIESGCIVDRFQSLVNCEVRVPSFITAYTGISQQMVDDAPSVKHVMRHVVSFVGDTPLVAHSATFDQRFYLRECRQLGISMVVEPFICSMRLSRRVYPQFKSHALGALAHALNLKHCGAAHRAAADAEMTAELMLRLGRDIGDQHEGLALTNSLLRRLMHMPVARVRADLEKLCA
jgi:DNA polymerase-3 subunit epsilon